MSDYPVRTLLIEDNPADARLNWKLLAGSDFRLHIAEDLSGGVQQIQKPTYDAILLDLSLPNNSGIDTVLRACANLPRIAIVVLTGLDDPKDGALAVQSIPLLDLNPDVLTQISLKQLFEQYRKTRDGRVCW